MIGLVGKPGMWIYITHVTGLKIFKMSKQNPRSCQDTQDPRSCQDTQDEILERSYQEFQDVKIKPKIFPRYSSFQDFPKILARYSRCQTLGEINSKWAQANEQKFHLGRPIHLVAIVYVEKERSDCNNMTILALTKSVDLKTPPRF